VNDSIEDRVQLDQLAEEFAQRRRRGETPSLSEYSERFPHLAQEIRDLFPALELLEQFRPAVGEMTVDDAGPKPSKSGLNLEQLGDYRILRELGRGGMGVVYEAEQLSLGRRVAIKVLPGRAFGDTSLNRFLREAKAAAGLHHSNIVPVFGVGEDQGLHYYVMQYIIGLGMDQVLVELRRMEGREAVARSSTQGPASATAWQMAQSLVGGIKSGDPPHPQPLSPGGARGATVEAASASAISTSMTSNTETRNVYWQSVAKIGKQVADALAYAHAKGTVHRDIKPSNLILDDKGTVWVTDFGLAKATADTENLTHAGDIVGTLRYMAPERFEGKSDVRGDLFSLGITLFEMLTLQPAYEASDRESLLEQIRTADPPRPRKIRPSIPRDLETIVLKAIDRDPERRYQTGAELADDLQRFLEDRPIQARRVASTEHVWRWAKRNPLVATLTGFVAILLVMMTLGATGMNVLLRDERNTARSNEERAVKAEKKSQHERDQALDNLGAAYLAQARALRLAKQPGFRKQGLEVIRKAAEIRTSLELRNEAAALLLSPDVTLIREWENRADGFTWIGTHPDARAYAVRDMKGNVSIRSMDDRKELDWLSWPGPHATLAHFSASGRYVGVKYHDDHSLRFAVWDLQKKERVWEHEGGHPQAVAFSADDRWLALTTQRNEWVLVDIASKTVVKTLPTGPAAFAFDPASKVLAVHLATGVEIRRLPSLAIEQQLVRKTSTVAAGPVRWIPGGQRLAACVGSQISVYDMADPKKTKPMVLHGDEMPFIGMLISHRGDWLLASAGDGSARIWDLFTGRCEIIASGQVAGISPDDRRIAFGAGNRMGIWEFHTAPECRRTPVANANFEGGLSPDGRWYANNGPKGMEIYELASGKLVASQPLFPVRGVQFTPDGRGIIASIETGCLRWPIRLEGPTGLTLGEPEVLINLPAHHCGGALSRDGKYLAFVGAKEAVYWRDLEKRQNVHVWRDHPRVASIAISPDARWLATGNWQGTRVLVRDTSTGKLAAEVPAPMSAYPLFSPCGKWLLTCNPDDFRLWDVPSFQLVRTFPRKSHGNWNGGAAFSKDSQILALDTTPKLIQLFDPATGAEYMSLETAPRKVAAFLHGFTRNADVLVGGGAGQFRCFWDLRAVRTQLREMNLDWDDPPEQARR